MAVRLSRRPRGFSLVEVALALGIVSFGLMVSVSLLPVSLKTIRDASERTIESQLVDAVKSDLLMTPYGTLRSSSPLSYYFDQEGMAQDTQSSETYYRLTVEIHDPLYPGHDQGPLQAVDAGLVQAKITVASGPTVTVANKDTRTYSILISDAGL